MGQTGQMEITRKRKRDEQSTDNDIAKELEQLKHQLSNVSTQTWTLLTNKHFPGATLSNQLRHSLQWLELYEIFHKMAETSFTWHSMNCHMEDTALDSLRVFVANNTPHVTSITFDVKQPTDLTVCKIEDLLNHLPHADKEGSHLICKIPDLNECDVVDHVLKVKPWYTTTVLAKPSCSPAFHPDCYVIFRNRCREPIPENKDDKFKNTITFLQEKQLKALRIVLDDAKCPWKYEQAYVFSERQKAFALQFAAKHHLERAKN